MKDTQEELEIDQVLQHEIDETVLYNASHHLGKVVLEAEND